MPTSGITQTLYLSSTPEGTDISIPMPEPTNVYIPEIAFGVPILLDGHHLGFWPIKNAASVITKPFPGDFHGAIFRPGKNH